MDCTRLYSVLAGSANDFGRSIALDSQHNAWIAGETSSAGFTGGSTQATPDALILKVSPQGAFTWLKTFGGSGEDRASGVAVDGDDNPWFTGQTCSPDFPATSGFNNPVGRCSVFVVRLTNQPQQGTTNLRPFLAAATSVIREPRSQLIPTVRPMSLDSPEAFCFQSSQRGISPCRPQQAHTDSSSNSTAQVILFIPPFWAATVTRMRTRSLSMARRGLHRGDNNIYDLSRRFIAIFHPGFLGRLRF
jgi:hypothetical protein